MLEFGDKKLPARKESVTFLLHGVYRAYRLRKGSCHKPGWSACIHACGPLRGLRAFGHRGIRDVCSGLRDNEAREFVAAYTSRLMSV